MATLMLAVNAAHLRLEMAIFSQDPERIYEARRELSEAERNFKMYQDTPHNFAR